MNSRLSGKRAAIAGLIAGGIAAIAMTLVMLVLAWSIGIATPLVILGDRLSVFIPPGPFLGLMGKVGGYNHLKQLGVGGTIAGQVLVGSVVGTIYGLTMRRNENSSAFATLTAFVLLPLTVGVAFLWSVLGTSYRGWPISSATVITIGGLLVSFLVFERVLVLGFRYLAQPAKLPNELEYSPAFGRRAFILGGVGLLMAGGGAAVVRRLWQVATFSYDGTQYKGAGVEPITPNDKFYCVTKNVVDPRVNEADWRLEVTGLVQHPQTFKIERLKAQPAMSQETTLMCISNGIDAGLMSNAIWRGVSFGHLLRSAGPLPGAARVRLHGVDNYTDTFPLTKAFEPTTLVAYEMNGQPLPDRHGFPARAIVPGYFGEKNVKWLTRIELTGAEAKGFYEKQGWGPNFVIPTRSRIDQPENNASFHLTNLHQPLSIKGVAFAGDRGVSRVEVSMDDGKTWQEAKIDYPGTKLSWVLWSYDWFPSTGGEYHLVVRATDATGTMQRVEPDRGPFSGVTGLHKITVHFVA